MKDRGGTISPAVLLRFLRLLMCSVDIHEHPSKLFVKSMPREPFHPVSWYPTGRMKIKSAAWWRVQAIGLVLGLVEILEVKSTIFCESHGHLQPSWCCSRPKRRCMIYRKNYVSFSLFLLFFCLFFTSELIVSQSAHIDSSYITEVVTL